MKKSVRIFLIIFTAVICVGSYFGAKKFEDYVNNSEGQLVKVQYRNGETDKNLNVTVEETDSWFKALPEEFTIDEHFKNSTFPRRNDVNLMECVGRTIEITLENVSEYRINRWYIEYDIPEDLYLDKAWNGTVELHQFAGENVDEITASSEATTTSEIYSVPVTELYLIPLAKGDKLIYHPSDQEYPLVENGLTEGNYSSTKIGMIFYTEEEAFELSDFNVYYYVVKALDEYPLYTILQALLVIGFVSFISILVFSIVSERYDKVHQHDMEIISQAISIFSKFIDSKDKYTHNHSYRVAEYSKLIAAKLGMSVREIEDIYYIGLLHDTGKIAIDDKILNKPGKLSNEEFEAIKSHTTIGANMLKDFTTINNIQIGALYHHERYDGMGYPMGVIGEEIPLVGRIIAVADAYDAMSSDRCYRSHLEKETIIEQLISNKGKQFDPALVDIFVKLIESGEVDEIKKRIQDLYGRS